MERECVVYWYSLRVHRVCAALDVRSWCERAQVSFGVGLGFSSLSNTCALRAYLPMQFVTSKLASFAVL
jgi:hypothetical protein